MRHSESFSTAIAELLPVEGGYVNDPADSGGETNFGVTIAVARAFGFTKPMRDMTRADAEAIYRSRFWDANRLDEVNAESPLIARELFDTGVNQGVSAAGKYFQRCLNVFNREAKAYPDITADGRVGPMTIAAFVAFMGSRASKAECVAIMLRALNALQGSFYIELAEQRSKDERFVAGWFLNRVA